MGYSETPEVVAVLLDAGADMQAISEGGCTPLHWAAEHSKTPKVVELLLDRGADIESRADEWRPLHHAAGYGKTSAIVELLLEVAK